MAKECTEKPIDTGEGKQDAPSAGSAATGFAAFASAQSPFATAKASSGDTTSKEEESNKAGEGADSTKTEQKTDAPLASGFAAFASTESPFASAAPGAQNTNDTSGASGFSAFASVRSPFASTASKPESTLSGSGEPKDEKPPAFGTSFAPSGLQLEEQETKTGEEDETTVSACHGSLFVFDEGRWKSRGGGIFKINVREDSVEGSDRTKKTARLLMRSDGVLSLLLNSPILSDMTCQNPKNTTRIIFVAVEDSKLKPFTLKISGKNAAIAEELHKKIGELQQEIKSQAAS